MVLETTLKIKIVLTESRLLQLASLSKLTLFILKMGGVENNSVPNNSVGLPNISGCYFEAKHTKHSKDFACSTLSLSHLSRAFFSKKPTLGAGPNFRNHRIIRYTE